MIRIAILIGFALSLLQAIAVASKIAVMETAFNKRGDVTSFQDAKAAGYAAIQMHSGQPDGMRQDPIDPSTGLAIGNDPHILDDWKKVSTEHGVEIVSLCAGSLNKCQIWDKDRKVAMRIAKQTIDGCHRLGVKIMLFPFFGPSRFQDSDLALNGIAGFMRELLPYAEEKDVVIGIEAPVTTARVLELMKLCGFPKHLKIYYDTGNLFEREDIYETIRKHAKEHFCEIHIKPSGHSVIGKGAIDLKKLAEALDAADYDQWLVYESNRHGRDPVGNRQGIEELVSLRQVTAQASERKPNVLVILTDDQGWGDIGYNNPNVYTPNLDKLATEGATLTQHYVMPQCTPTRLALFTGRYPGRFGISGLQASNRPIIPHGTLTMASFLKAQGYKTYLTGKWHLGSWAEHGPNHHGFDYSYGALAGAVGAYVHLYRAPMLVHPNAITWHRNHEIIPGYENGRHVTDLVTEDAIKVIKRKRDAPFFLYLPYFAPHTPLDERDKLVKVPTQLDGDRRGRWYNEEKNRWFNDPKGLIQKEKDPEKRLFLAVLHHVDNAIGRVVSALEETGQREDTIIFFSSDNGPQISWAGGSYPSDLHLTDFNQPIPFRGAKSDVWEGGIRVPGFVNWPGKIKPKTVDSVQHVIDWLPTIASMIGARVSAPQGQPDLDGEDFSSRLLTDDSSMTENREIYSLHRVNTDKWALRRGDWKVVYYGKNEPSEQDWELYHLAEDRAEKADVASANPDKVRELHQRFLAHRAKDIKEHNFPDFEEASN